MQKDDFISSFYFDDLFHAHSQNSLSKRKFKPYFASLFVASLLNLATFSTDLKADDWALDTRVQTNGTNLSTDTSANKTTITQTSGADTDGRVFNNPAWNSGTHTLTDLEIDKGVTLNSTSVSVADNWSIFLGNSSTTSVGSITNNGNIQAFIAGSRTTISNFTNTGTITGSTSWAAFDSGNFTTNVSVKNTITNFTNSGTIKVESGTKNAVWFRNTDNENFSNSGTISSANAHSVFLQNSNTNKFENSGTITATGSYAGVYSQGATTKEFTNSGTISGGRYGVHIFTGSNYSGTAQLVDKFVNTGTIEATTYEAAGAPDTYTFGAAVFIQTSSIESFENSGTLKSKRAGLLLSGNGNTTFKNITNSGTIEVSGDLYTTGIHLAGFTTQTHLENLTNTGTIKGGRYGISVETGIIETLTNSGTIEAENTALHFLSLGGASSGKVGTLSIEDGGVMKGGVNGVVILGNANSSTIDNLLIEEGGLLEGTTGSGIIVGNGSNPNYYFNGNMDINGTIRGGTAGIENNSLLAGDISIGSNGSIEGGIVNQGSMANIGGSITNSSGSSLEITNTNQANITGNITNTAGGSVSIANNEGAKLESSIINNGSGNINVNNQGTAIIGGNFQNNNAGNINISNTGKVGDSTIIENNGVGSTNVSNWLITTDSKGNVKPLEVSGSNVGNIKVDNIIFDVNNIGNLNDVAGDTDNFIKVDTSKDSSVNDPQEVNYKIFGNTNYATNDPSINVKVDNSGLTFNVEAARTTGAALGKTLIANTRSRNAFIASAMSNVMKTTNLIHYKNTLKNKREFAMGQYEVGSLYASSDMIQSDILTRANYAADRDGIFFMLPYFSYSKVELQSGLESKGHTLGTIFGYSFLNPKNEDIWGVYAGYDDFDASSPSVSALNINAIDLKSRTYFTGLEYYKTLTRVKDSPVYVRGSSQFAVIKNDITKGNNNGDLKAEPKSYAYGLGAHLGTHIVLNEKNVLSPEIGLAYEGGFTRAFNLTNGTQQREKYFVHKTNFYKTNVGLSYYRDWHKHLKTVVDTGFEYTLNPKVDNPEGYYAPSNLRFGGGKTRLDENAAYVGVNVAVPLNEAFYFTINYNANFTDNTTLHTGYAKFSYVW